MTPQFASSVIADAVGGDTRIFTELGFQAAATETREAGRIYGNPLSGGLGWALPAALGALLAERDSLAVAVCGDGSYIFANPVACHQAAAMHELPVLAIVFNNGVWNAVRRATLGMYPDSAAAKANVIPLTSLGPRPDYAAVARAHGAHAERIDNPDDLAPALKRAIDVIRNERRQAFLDVTVAYLPGST